MISIVTPLTKPWPDWFKIASYGPEYQGTSLKMGKDVDTSAATTISKGLSILVKQCAL